VHCDTVKLTMSSPITGTGLPLNNVSPVLHFNDRLVCPLVENEKRFQLMQPRLVQGVSKSRLLNPYRPWRAISRTPFGASSVRVSDNPLSAPGSASTVGVFVPSSYLYGSIEVRCAQEFDATLLQNQLNYGPRSGYHVAVNRRSPKRVRRDRERVFLPLGA